MKRSVAAALATALWGLFTFLGYRLTAEVTQRHIPGYPNAGQWHYYVYFPAIMLLISIGVLLLARKLPFALFLTAWFMQLLVFVPFFLGYTGGV